MTSLRPKTYVAPNRGPRHSGGRPNTVQHISAVNTYPRTCFIKHFLGFTHISARGRRGHFIVKVKTMKKRLRRSLKAVSAWCKAHRHEPLTTQQATLNAKLRGHYQYYGRASNTRSIRQFYIAVCRLWKKWLARRSRGIPLYWVQYQRLLHRYPLMLPRITRPWAGLRSPL
jgi:RNA-directed DNA polymerase